MEIGGRGQTNGRPTWHGYIRCSVRSGSKPWKILTKIDLAFGHIVELELNQVLFEKPFLS